MHCEFDGRVSLVHFKGELYAYVRANVHPQAGGRYVQFVKRSLAPAGAWSNFQMISIQNYPMVKAAANDLYFPAMNVNPADESTLLVLFPAALLNKASIALSFSCDGHHFSTMELFVPSRPAFGHRTAVRPLARTCFASARPDSIERTGPARRRHHRPRHRRVLGRVGDAPCLSDDRALDPRRARVGRAS
ncbi:hypothetical protein M885DRAFT_327882 [Pelagophyceae sp. CCMP2097]|nr:hypothetical protein M885DRAFT_327882 [Pelagophyceae sp. CCMP2097]